MEESKTEQSARCRSTDVARVGKDGRAQSGETQPAGAETIDYGHCHSVTFRPQRLWHRRHLAPQHMASRCGRWATPSTIAGGAMAK